MDCYDYIEKNLSSILLNLLLKTKNAVDMLKVIEFFSSVKLCIGNPDIGLVKMWKKKCISQCASMASTCDSKPLPTILPLILYTNAECFCYKHTDI